VRQFTLAIDPRKFCADISERLLKQHNLGFMVGNLALEFCTSARTVHLKRHQYMSVYEMRQGFFKPFPTQAAAAVAEVHLRLRL
jgi:hypothetical protein